MYLQAHGTFIKDHDGKSFGALIVLNDITQMKRLENIRRDFVANVSHELKTPITSIIGFVETLSQGAIDDKENAGRFLEIIARHADRLNAIIEDLLLLSRIEGHEEDDSGVVKEASKIKSILSSALLICEPKASTKNIHLALQSPDEIKADVNAPLLEQAVINLVDNAIKYSEEGSHVRVEASAEGEEILIRVIDDGCGIPEEHIPRLFERFYRVDKARSRNLGGTGLGLAIVKHIVNAHGGIIEVESIPQKGSTFTIRIPIS
jgi:two-component system phosphate regulon sensor histidine kinase PhoR